MSAEKSPADAPVSDLRSVPLKKRLVWGAIAGAAIGAGVFGLSFLEIFQKYEWRTLDWRQQVMARPTEATKKVVIVLVDEYSVQEMRYGEEGVTFPWPRDVYAYLIDVLKEKGAAAAIVMDVYFFDPWPNAGLDKTLAESTKKAGNVIFATKLETSPNGVTPRFGKDEKAAVEKARVPAEGWRFPPRQGTTQFLAPISELTATARVFGLANVLQDSDNTLRRADLLYSFPDASTQVGSLGLQSARVVLGTDGAARLEGTDLLLKERRIPLGRDGRLLVRFYGKEQTFETHNAVSILRTGMRLEQGKPPLVDLSTFKDKVVILGFSNAAQEDVHAVPVSIKFPGPEFNATVCANILGGEFISELGGTGRLLVLMGIGLAAGVLAFAVWQPVPAAFVSFVLFAIHVGAAFLAFRTGIVVDVFFPGVAVLGAFVTATLAGYLTEGRAKREVSRAFGQYLSPVVIRELMKNPDALKLGGETREVAVYFSDIAGFSTFSEGMSAQELVSFLNVYLTAMTDVILDRGGVVDKYNGDSIMAFWGAPVSVEAPGKEACLAFLEQREVLAGLNQRFQAEGRPVLKVRVGLNQAPVVVGNMGSTKRFNYTLMGDEVNLASRLEGANKFFGTGVMLTDAVRRSAADAVVTRRLGRIQVVGKSVPVEVHELLGRSEDVKDAELRWLDRYHEALKLAEAGDRSVSSRLESLFTERKDKVVEMLLNKCREAEETGTAWDGVWVLKEKG